MCGLLPSPRRPRQALPSQGRRRELRRVRLPADVVPAIGRDPADCRDPHAGRRASDAAREPARDSSSRTSGTPSDATVPARRREADSPSRRVRRVFHTAISRAWPFEVWFTRILINGCLDRRKARVRRERWLVPSPAEGIEDIPQDRRVAVGMFGNPSSDANPEARLLGRERRARMTAAIDRLEGRQRTVFMLCHYGDCTPREVSVMTGLKESTVRVHLFRAARKLRHLLGGQP